MKFLKAVNNMNIFPKINLDYKYKWLLDIVVIFFIVIFILSLIFIAFNEIYKNKIYPGIYLGGENIGGITKNEATKILNKKIDLISGQGINFNYKGNKIKIYPIISSLGSDLAYEIIHFDTKKTIDEAYTIGRNGNIFENIKKLFILLVYGERINMQYYLEKDYIKNTLADYYLKSEAPPKNAKIIFKNYNDYYIEKEKSGKILDYEKAINDLNLSLSRLSSYEIDISSFDSYPVVTKNDYLNYDIDSEIKKILNSKENILFYKDKKWIMEKNIIKNWLILKKENNILSPSFDFISIKEYVKDNVSPEINLEPQEAKFNIIDGKVVEFKVKKDGIIVSEDESAKKIINNLEKNINETEIITIIKKSNNTSTSTNDYEISEIIGTGKSNFAGSPNNRRINIKVGADSLNGILIKPDETFSLINALGKIDKSTGYLPELVIKENKTIPEYGGGLCQIGTTVFRAALDSGLPIIERRNHSYRVQYYEPAGTDATIYDPSPDLKFKNDTGNYILVQSRIDGNDLYFEFWGKKDGRLVDKTNPVISNIVKPGPTKIIETLDLKPGEKKCTEKAHNGADAYFDYKVTYLNGEIAEKRFSSHYVPWREVCLLGVEKLSSDNTNTSSSTPEKTVITPVQ